MMYHDETLGEARASFLWNCARDLVTWNRPEHFEGIDSGSPLESAAFVYYCHQHIANGVKFDEAKRDARLADIEYVYGKAEA